MKRNLKGLVMVVLMLLGTIALTAEESVEWYKKGDNATVAATVQAGGLYQQISFINSNVVRIRVSAENRFESNNTNIVVAKDFSPQRLRYRYRDGKLHILGEKIDVVVDPETGAKQFLHKGKILLSEDPSAPYSFELRELQRVKYNDAESRIERGANGDVMISKIESVEHTDTAYRARVSFQWSDGEALFGWGSHQEGYYNLRGTMQYLYQHNLKATVPVLVSSEGYGLLFDAGSTMEFHDDTLGSYVEMNAVKSIDYYFMLGPEMDQIVAEYRGVTGGVPMLPRYMLGYIQSKERYASPKDIDSVLTRFRENSIPIDVIVQDWNYWNPAWWGHKRFYEKSYPNPDKMIEGVHRKNAKFMLSIWPTANGDEADIMNPKGYTLGRGIYDAYNPDARKLYWEEFVNKNLFSLGVDAWWCDGTEPIDADWNPQSNSIAQRADIRYEKNGKELENLLGEMRANTYSLYHSQGIYENQRATTSDKRVVNLTRSSYAGQQRYGTIVWNGDTKATWDDFRAWIPSGMNFFYTGVPYWTIDVGAFFVKRTGQWFWAGDYATGPLDMGYREFYLRNLQFSQWLPLFRSHGCDFAREPWQFGSPGDAIYDAIIEQIELRYRLLPYNYSLMAMVTQNNYTMTRPLLFDFRDDKEVYNIADQFMWGPAFMAAPVTTPIFYDVNSRKIENPSPYRTLYLPGGRLWYDFWTGKSYTPSQHIEAYAPISYIPVYVRAGSIVPMGPQKQYSWQESNEPIEIRIYPGADGEFVLYDDEGDNYNYEDGAYSTIALRWDDRHRTLHIGERKGAYKGMRENIEFNIVVVSDGYGIGVDSFEGKRVDYFGSKVAIKL